IVLFLSREETKEEKDASIILTIAKHRNGELGRIRLDMQGALMTFTESGNQDFNKSAPVAKSVSKQREGDSDNSESENAE
ncbi:MAG: hypothetical protein ACI4SK_02930, partial [Christensenellales bacterium]